MENKEKVGAGILGAFLFSLVGVIIWIIIYQLGYLAAISGLIGVICAIKGYSVFAKKESIKGVVIAIIVMLIMMVVAWYAGLVISVYRELDGMFTISEAFDLTNYCFKDAEFRSGAIGDLVKGILFCVIGGVGYAVTSIKRIKAEKEYKDRMAKENGTSMLNGEPEYHNTDENY
ncbi:MAG: hypothetical protein IKU25_04965 [Clostridia bacterium]|nr:hypothetical protein [Clostridia bacterium]